MDTSLDQLKSCPDLRAVRSALYSLCSRFGSIKRLDIIDSRRGGTRQAMCFMRMSTIEQETQLVRELGVGRFGGDLVFIVALDTVKSDPVRLPALAGLNGLNMTGLSRGAGAAALI